MNYYSPEPVKKRHRLRTILLSIAGAIVLLIVVGAALGSGKSTPAAPAASAGPVPSASPAASHAAAPAAGPGIGSTVKDGKFAFKITRVSHRASVGDVSLGLGETAQGRFTELHMKVTNIGNVAQTLDDSNLYVYDSQGRKFDADSTADIDANPAGGGAFLESINPGNSETALVLFDLPKGDKAVKAELHDSAFSGGVTVSLVHHH